MTENSYCFTATVNTPAAALKIASLERLLDRVVPVAVRVGTASQVNGAGIVPGIGMKITKQLDNGASGFLSGIFTAGGIAVSALYQLNTILIQNCRKKPDTAFAMLIPANDPPLGRSPEIENFDEIPETENRQLTKNIPFINHNIVVEPGSSPYSPLLRRNFFPDLIKTDLDMNKVFFVSDACTSCRTCENICPAGNITLIYERPSWQYHCELCCACLHFCPVEAIQLNMAFVKK